MGKEREYSVSFVKWFSELSNKDISIAGGKGASLAEMYNNKFPIPPGFVITAQAYGYFIEKTGLAEQMKEILSKIDIEDTDELSAAAKKVRELIEKAEMPKEMQESIIENYDILDSSRKALEIANWKAANILKQGHEMPFVAVRSSATTEDLADASFAGQQESFLNVKGDKELIKKVKECMASLFTARAVYYRTKKGFDHSKSQLAVVVQKMIDSDKSGVMFSKNPVKSDESILIEAVWGLGEGIVSGQIKPDTYTIDNDLDNFKILERLVPAKKIAFTRDSAGNNTIAKLTDERGKQQVLGNYELKVLSNYARKLEEHYKKPQDIEFAISNNEIFIVQSRPVTTKFTVAKNEVKGKVLLAGLGASPGISSGVVRIIHNIKELDKIKKGDILVTEMTNPDMVVAMQKAAGIITDEGGITSHAAIVSREMGIPAVVGTNVATKNLKDGQEVTVDGNTGRVIDGKGETKLAEIKPITLKTKTKLKVIVDLPDYAERAAQSGVMAVGLTRIEGIIAESGKHPLYYVKNKKIDDYVNLLHDNLRRILIHFNEVWIRSSDIRSDEFRHLEGSSKVVEGNPMLGNHGIRFAIKYPEILESELRAVKMLAQEFPDKKIGFMIPQVINVSEFIATRKAAEQLVMPENVRLGIMVETPAAVQVIDQLCEAGISFASFGSNDLTQYILAIDRNNEEIQNLYDEMNPAVLSAIGYVIRRCKEYNVETSICGQAGSKEEMVKFLVKEGISSISVNADAAANINQTIYNVENAIEQKLEIAMEGVTAENMIIAEKDAKIEEREERLIEKALPQSMMVMNGMIEQEMAKIEEKKDMEEVILEQLGEDNSGSGGNNEGGDYNPSIQNDEKNDIPKLNDAIPITGEMIDSHNEENEAAKEIKEEVVIENNAENVEEEKIEETEEDLKEADDLINEADSQLKEWNGEK